MEPDSVFKRLKNRYKEKNTYINSWQAFTSREIDSLDPFKSHSKEQLHSKAISIHQISKSGCRGAKHKIAICQQGIKRKNLLLLLNWDWMLEKNCTKKAWFLAREHFPMIYSRNTLLCMQSRKSPPLCIVPGLRDHHSQRVRTRGKRGVGGLTFGSI